jgi:uncharacterized membrane protein
MSDCTTMFAFRFKDKVLSLISLVLFALLIAQIVAGFFLIKSQYKQHSKYFYDNCNNTITGSFYLLVEYGLLNFLLGAAHILLVKHYHTQLVTLLLIEVSFCCFVVYSIRNLSVFEWKYLQWIVFAASFLRASLIVTYFLDNGRHG